MPNQNESQVLVSALALAFGGLSQVRACDVGRAAAHRVINGAGLTTLDGVTEAFLDGCDVGPVEAKRYGLEIWNGFVLTILRPDRGEASKAELRGIGVFAGAVE
jgi:hypothetical protein